MVLTKRPKSISFRPLILVHAYLKSCGFHLHTSWDRSCSFFIWLRKILVLRAWPQEFAELAEMGV